MIGQNVRTSYDITTSESGVTIPLSAIQFEKDGATVFVLTYPNTFEKRSIGINRVTEKIAVVHSGLKPGDVVATSQIFSLKALEKFEEFAD